MHVSCMGPGVVMKNSPKNKICWLQGATIHTSNGLLLRLKPRCNEGQEQNLCKVSDDSKGTDSIEKEMAAMPSNV